MANSPAKFLKDVAGQVYAVVVDGVAELFSPSVRGVTHPHVDTARTMLSRMAMAFLMMLSLLFVFRYL